VQIANDVSLAATAVCGTPATIAHLVNWVQLDHTQRRCLIEKFIHGIAPKVLFASTPAMIPMSIGGVKWNLESFSYFPVTACTPF
jgi:hypothetical protein